ncbi:hypothetical protein KSF_006070 [Reticulibacter mediterranei]|uniref:Uncharacterized protein n=1 Tax=Reticulibacter mediterranei TaxID=2778369 RepID=A0A8J3IG32_9CHLR|nr:hypothetical protein [Reticulibacter mediterranei]GHO90559.1 hypothetical protein KSF_006070 [Reticulibacter mediterranei]
MTDIRLNLTLEETNIVLEALGQMPYARVYLLIAKVQQQATVHLHEQQQPSPEKQNQNEKPAESTGGPR